VRRRTGPCSRRRPPVRAAFALAVLIVLVASTAAVAGCGGSIGQASAEEVAAREVRVTATTNWHTDLARAIGGERAEVRGLMGPGVDPHLYEARAGDVRTLSDSDLVVWNGLELEGKMEEVFAEVASSRKVVAVGEAVPVRERIGVQQGGGRFDPHIWFDARLWERAAQAVADGYRQVDPRHAADYDRRLARFVAAVREADADARERLRDVPRRSRVLVTSHDAFAYFARSYDFEVAPIQGKSTAGEATTADIERVADTVARARLRSVFIESSVPRQTIEAVLAASRARGQPTRIGGELFGDSLGEPGTPEGGYAGALRRNAELIAEGLR
jgi:manganese/zinc/iron transport system substrate-binding protein